MTATLASTASSALLLIWSFGQVATAATTTVPNEGTTQRRSLAPNERHHFSLQLRVGDYLAADISEQGADLTVTVFDPSGAALIEERTPQTNQDISELRLVARSAGEFRLDVLSTAPQTGRYTMRIAALRRASARDSQNASAYEAQQRATAFEREQTAAGYRKAIEEFVAAADRYRAGGDLRGEARSLRRVALLQDDPLAAIEYVTQVLKLYRAASDPIGEVRATTHLGWLHLNMAQPTKALVYLQQALALVPPVGEEYSRASVLSTLGWCYHMLGEYGRASALYRESISLWRAVGSPLGEAVTLGYLGLLHLELGDFERSRRYLQDSVDLHRTANPDLDGTAGAAEILANLAEVQLALGKAREAGDLLEQSLTLARRRGSIRPQVRALVSLAAVRTTRTSATVGANIEEALGLARQISDRRLEALVLRHRGDWHMRRGELPKAKEDYANALALQSAMADMHGEADTLLALTRLRKSHGDLDAARATAGQAIDIVESLHGRVADPGLRTAYVASAQTFYDIYIDVLMHLHDRDARAGYNLEALQISERGRVRGLLDALTERQVDIRRGVEPLLLERERELRRALNAQDQQVAAARNEASASAGRTELGRIANKLLELQADIRLRSPRYAELTQPRSISPAMLQQALDSDTVLLEYWLGSERSFLWAVTDTSIVSHVLPPASAIKHQVRRYFTTLSARPPAGQSRADAAAKRVALDRSAADLSRTLLGPVAAKLAGKRLIVVSHGELQYLPFATLPLVSAGQGAATPLIEQHEIVSLPSASVLTALRAQAAQQTDRQKTIAVFADPVFSADDERVVTRPPTSSTSKPAPPRELSRAAGDADLSGLHRLRFSRIEAGAIAALVDSSQRLDALDFRANRAQALDPGLAEYRIVHFATHGLVNMSYPELSGLALSAVDEHGRAQDGLLRLHEIFNLRLRAQLVVLSACQSALGPQIDGEGLIALTRGFMYAGTPRVIATLWNVDDRASAQLMKRFYEGLLTRKLTPAAALREAQLSIAREDRWSAPYYWAGFILQGDWK